MQSCLEECSAGSGRQVACAHKPFRDSLIDLDWETRIGEGDKAVENQLRKRFQQWLKLRMELFNVRTG